MNGRALLTRTLLPDLAKYTESFRYLLTGAQSMGKNKKGLSYSGSAIHRFVKGFVMQGGDVTRGDGSGGESICEGRRRSLPAGLPC